METNNNAMDMHNIVPKSVCRWYIVYHDLILTISISIIRGRAQKWHIYIIFN